MGYSGDYSLFARCISECFATCTFIFFLLSLLANKLLPKTKGHDLSFGWLAFGIGMAVFLPVQFLGFISTALNPAMSLGAAIAGQIDWRDWPALALSQTIGAFLGALLMFLYYYPQFKTVPEAPPERDADRLLRTRDDIGRRGLDYVSYNTTEPAARISSQVKTLRRRFSSRRGNSTVYTTTDVLGKEAGKLRPTRMNSVSVADLHHRLSALDENFNSEMTMLRRHSEGEPTSPILDHNKIYVELTGGRPMIERELSELASIPEHGLNLDQVSLQERSQSKSSDNASRPKSVEERIDFIEDSDPLVNASRVADQNMKLAIFCTRPAAYYPLINLYTEAIATFFLVLGILMIKERSELLFEGYADVYKHGVVAFYVGLLITVLVLCLGGMGVAMNPARDLAPRIAHWILPIPGKGKSEWYYAWIPVLGPFIGSILAGYFFLALKELNKNLKDGGQYDEEFDSINSLLS